MCDRDRNIMRLMDAVCPSRATKEKNESLEFQTGFLIDSKGGRNAATNL